MLIIDNLIWVIAGMVGLWVYNRIVSIAHPQPEGWVYLLAVVFFAFPYYVIDSLFLSEINISKFGELLVFIISVVICGAWGFVVALLRNKAVKLRTSDPFHVNCNSWLEKLVFITLDSKRIYLGTLIDHTSDIKFEYTIKIIAICSGYRNKYGKVIWDFKYPLQKDATVEIIIPKSKIATFALWNNSKEFKNAPI